MVSVPSGSPSSRNAPSSPVKVSGRSCGAKTLMPLCPATVETSALRTRPSTLLVLPSTSWPRFTSLPKPACTTSSDNSRARFEPGVPSPSNSTSTWPVEPISPESVTLPSASATASRVEPTSCMRAPTAGLSEERPCRVATTVARSVPGPTTGFWGSERSRHPANPSVKRSLPKRIEAPIGEVPVLPRKWCTLITITSI